MRAGGSQSRPILLSAVLGYVDSNSSVGIAIVRCLRAGVMCRADAAALPLGSRVLRLVETR